MRKGISQWSFVPILQKARIDFSHLTELFASIHRKNSPSTIGKFFGNSFIIMVYIPERLGQFVLTGSAVPVDTKEISHSSTGCFT